MSNSNFKSSSRVPSKRVNECDGDWEKKVKAISRCNILKSDAFTACHRRVSLSPYFKSCIEEVCSCQDKDNNSHCHCNALDSYVIQCQSSGIKISPDWESLSSCDTNNSTLKVEKTDCPKGAIFTSCVNPCPRTCNNMSGLHSSSCDKSKQCNPGCDCPPGLVWNINRCVLPRNCKVTSLMTARA